MHATVAKAARRVDGALPGDLVTLLDVPEGDGSRSWSGCAGRRHTRPTRYVEVRRRFLCEHPGHVLDGWPLPAD
ncbi:hypothetical protein PV336_43305 [Streptomyces sp. MI02-2A]|nr:MULTISPECIES: hypothetical protein [unclassified Streptomyces]KUJ56207.1 hypothetical protein ADL25_04890 [Streptomyces sp. NRRL F-5122]MDX3265908.1 hypothetical protein [Streptomyces sp. MI02-2A]